MTMLAAVIVGGGAAGIAAARRLHDAGREVLLIEAGDRLGGRAHSLALPAVAPDARVDLGCGWLHSGARNPWTAIAEEGGHAVDRSPARWDEQWRDLGYSPADQRAFGKAWQRFEESAHAALSGPDRPLGDFVDLHDPWRPQIDAISGYANGAPLARVSLHDWAAYEDAASDDNWSLCIGYGTLVAGHIGGAPHRLGVRAERVVHRNRTIRVETGAGTIAAEAVIVCVPTTVLAREQLVFDPPLPAKHAAASALPLGLADKVFLHVAGGGLPTNGHLIGAPARARTMSHRLCPFGWPVIESFFGGDCAEGLEAEGPGAAADFAIGELAALLGSDWRRRLTPFTATRWRATPYIHGSYSHAAVGGAGMRDVLAEAVDDRIFFGGEACSRQDFSTAHGAYATGIAAAEAVLAR